MLNLFDTGTRRTVSAAGSYTYSNGIVHDSRVLQEHVLIYVTQGEWEIWQDETPYTVGAGDLLMLHAKHHHYGIKKCVPGTHTLYLHISAAGGDALLGDGAGWPERERQLALPVLSKCGKSLSIQDGIEQIIHAFWSPEPTRPIQLSALVDLLFFNLNLLIANAGMQNIPLINSCISIIRLNPQKVYSIQELSDQLHVSPRKLTAYFRQCTGTTIHQYQNDFRLKTAHLQIQQNVNRPFRDIAVNLGFYDEFHFSKLFKAKFGYSPNTLRKNVLLGKDLTAGTL